MKVKEVDDGKIIIEDADRNTLLLTLLARVMKIDLRVLLYFYEKYDVDTLFIFFMFSGMDIKFPSFNKLYGIIKNIDNILAGHQVEWKYGNKIKKEIEQLLQDKQIELNLNDRTLFPFGKEGIIDGEE